MEFTFQHNRIRVEDMTGGNLAQEQLDMKPHCYFNGIMCSIIYSNMAPNAWSDLLILIFTENMYMFRRKARYRVHWY